MEVVEGARCSGLFRGLLWLLFWLWLLCCLSLATKVCRRRVAVAAGLGGGMGATVAVVVEAAGGLLALGAESALLMVAAVWLEYPESLCKSLGRTLSMPG